MASWTDQFLSQPVRGTGAFGDLITSEATPVVQADFVYGYHEDLMLEFTGGSGSIAYADSMASVSSGATLGGYAFLRSLEAVRYRPGQGSLFRFTALFDTPTVGVSQVAGAFGGSENGLFFGYDYTTGEFGVCRNHDGKRTVYELEITAAASGAETLTVTLNGTATNVSLTAGTTAENAEEVAETSFTGWSLEANGSKVLFLASSVGARTDTYSVSSDGTSAGTLTQKLLGQAATDDWTPQDEWNIDRMDGNGPSGMTLDPSKGNVYAIQMQYLGFGSILFLVEDEESGQFQPVHRLPLANTLTAPTSSNPNYTLGCAVASITDNTATTIKMGSFAGFVEGPKVFHGPDHGYEATGSASASIPVLSVRNNNIFSNSISRVNLRDILLTFASASGSGSNKPITFKVILNGTLTDPLWTTYDQTHSIASVDTSATAITGGDTIYVGTFPNGGGVDRGLKEQNILLHPGQVVSTVIAPSGTAVDYVVGLTWKEDV